MKVAASVVNARRQKLADRLRTTPYIALSEICKLLKISEATARRDLRQLEGKGEIQRTYGGAFGDYISRFPSFEQRMTRNSEAKRNIAELARSFIKPNLSYFFDAGTTIQALAQSIAIQQISPLRVVTHSIPIAETLSVVSGVEVELLGGRLIPRQAVILGDTSIRALKMHTFDHAFMGAEGFNEQGIWNTQSEVVQFQRQILKMTKGKATFLLTSDKCEKVAPHFLVNWYEVNSLILNATSTTRSFVRKLKKTNKITDFYFVEAEED